MANAITTGTVTLTPTFNCIGVRAAFTNDDNANASIAVAFRLTGSGGWTDTYTPIIDYRTTLDVNGTPTANPYQFEGRVSIVGLQPNTSYDVRVTWSDPDGVNGTNPITTTVTTLSRTPPLGGNEVFVDAAQSVEGDGSFGNPYKTITNAIANTVAGDTITCRGGSYATLSVSASGTSSAWRRLRRYQSEVVTINATAASDNVTCSGSFWVWDGLHFTTSPRSCFRFTGDSHYVQNCVADDFGTDNVDGHGFVDGNGQADLYILSNNAHRAATGTGQANDGCFNVANHCIVDGNTFTGNIWDGLGNGFNSSVIHPSNCDYSNNTINGYQDDSMELEGSGMNCRAWGNTIITTNSQSLLSLAPIMVGPVYVFRNVLVCTSGGSTGLKPYPSGTWAEGWVYIFHNTMENTGTGGNEIFNATPNLVSLNNIGKCTGNFVYHGRTNSTYDYALAYITNGSDYAFQYNFTTDYATLALFQAGTGQGLHSLTGNPNYADAAYHLSATSPAIDRGILITNFNTADSAWPFTGNAPDMGAFEFSIQAPPPPSGHGHKHHHITRYR